MSVYNASSRVDVCYNTEGASVGVAHRINGHATAVNLINVPAFYVDSVDAAVDFLYSRNNSINFAVITDTHYNYNYKHSHKLLKSLNASGLIEKIVVLGDNIDTSDSSLRQSWLSDFSSLIPSMFYVMGNHELFSGTESEVYNWWKSNVYDEMSQATFGNTDKSYYYYDITNKKTRVFFCDANHDSVNQKEWLYSCIQELDSDWLFFIFCHEGAFVYTPEGYPTYDSYRDTTLFGTFENDFKDDSRCGGVICGHHHNDIIQQNSGIYQIALLCDANKSAGGTNEGCPMPTRSDSITAQSITIVSINPTEKTIELLRIGQIDNACGVDWSNKSCLIQIGSAI